MSAGRAERRRQARQMAKLRPELGLSADQWEGVIRVAEDNGMAEPQTAVRSTGVKQPMNPMGNMPPKVPGEHRWIATALYAITAPQIEVMYDPSKEKHLDNENLVTVFFGCIDCERQLGDITADTKCTAGDEWGS